MFHTYQISDFLDSGNADKAFHINRLEDMPPLPAHILTPHKHRFYELFLVKAGEATHMVDYRKYDLEADTFFFIAPGQLHFWSKANRESIRGYRLMFTEAFFLLREPDNRFLFEIVYFDNIYQNPDIRLSPAENALVYTYFELLHQEYVREDSAEKSLQSLLYLLLSEIRRLLQKRLPGNAHPHQAALFKQFIHLLETHYQERWSAADFAAAMHVSSRHLNRVVQSMTSQNVTQVIHDRCCLEARRLLSFTDLTVHQIADRLGFDDPAYFARMFRKNTGWTPSDFKKKLLANAECPDCTND